MSLPTKSCTSCLLTKTVDAFEPDERYLSGYRSQCDQCRHDRQRIARIDRRLRATYGITYVQYLNILAAQGGGCAVCGQIETRSSRTGKTWVITSSITDLSVDHDHETGAVRGLLCHRCNVGIGHMQDDPSLLDAAAAYLRRGTDHRQGATV